MHLGWPELLALLTSLAFGVVSAIVPIANAEAYVIASQVTAVAGPLPVAVGVGLGQSAGKLLLFIAVRRGRDFWFVRRQHHDQQPVGPVRTRIRAFLARLLELVGTNRWGLPIVALAAVVGIPPLYAVSLVAGASRMGALWFWLVVAAGRVTRFVLVALGVGWLPFW
ncbi:hypothetical protein [Microlunatus parietis]|uniref:Membrane protein YqaA with SNARE-associated domain n=1 Tax=Microlunatus parietis TaxID=682979 RepID=A0A7Y9I330_9ACTN|nr:hypothetical protein [Microlunatus parietis]NYE69237.1 membrane protein YqaA with SNARE-associated domain [Microlunatus parietis]